MTAPVTFNLLAAQDALTRSDEGADALPGDVDLIAAYDGYCQQEQARFEDAMYERDRLDWLASQCPACETGGLGEVCDDCADVPAEVTA